MTGTKPEIPTRNIVVGIFQMFPLPRISRYLAQQGWEWIVLDMQHSAISSETAYECIHTIRSAGSRPLVRVPVGGYAEIQKMLDLGAQGIVVPMVNRKSTRLNSSHT